MRLQKTIIKEITVDLKEYDDRLMIYRRVITEDNKIKGKSEGVIDRDRVSKIELSANIIESKYNFYKKGVLEQLKTKTFGSIKWEDNIAKDIYDISIEELRSEYVPLELIRYNHTIKDYNGESVPVPLSFDYIASRLTNENYTEKELVGIAKVLDDRDDIVWTKSTNTSSSKSGSRVVDIPYYNADEYHDKCIADFIWVPNKDDYDKILDKSKEPYSPIDRVEIAKMIVEGKL